MSTIDEHSKTGWYCNKGFKMDGVCVCMCVCDVNVSTAHHSLSLFPLSVIWNVPSTSHLHLSLPFLKVRDLSSIFFFGGAEALQQAGGKQPWRSLFTEKANMYLTFLDRRNNEKWILNPSGIRFTSSSSEYWKIKQLICFSSTTAINAHHWVDGVSFFFPVVGYLILDQNCFVLFCFSVFSVLITPRYLQWTTWEFTFGTLERCYWSSLPGEHNWKLS